MTPTARKDDLVIQEVDGETLVYDLKTNKVVSLNKTSSLIWQSCDGKKGPTEIASIIQDKIGTAVNEDIVYFAVNQLNKENLLKPPMDYTDKFTGMSRRDVIKKVGLGTMIALPIVASLTAPMPVMAQSCIPPAPGMCGSGLLANQSCNCSCECASGCCMSNNMNCTGSTTSGCGP